MKDRYFDLTKQDWAVMIGGLAISVAVGLLSGGKSPQFIGPVELWTAYLNAPVFLLAAYFIYRFQSVWGGKVARYLTLMSVGLAIQMLLWLPHIIWHIKGLPEDFAPAVLGLPGSFWLMLFHLAGPFSMALAAYGLYRLYQTNK